MKGDFKMLRLDAPMIISTPLEMEQEAPFAPEQLVITHLYNEETGRSVPVTGVVVQCDNEMTVVKVRNLQGSICALSVLTHTLSARE
jgi:hypothetical protein